MDTYLKMADGPIIWGRTDCCNWVDTIVFERHGLSLLPDGLIRYDSQFESIRALKNYCGGNVLDAAMKRAAELKLPRVWNNKYTWAVGVIAGMDGPTLAYFHQDKWLARSEDGIFIAPPHHAVIAWELPECLQ